MTYQLKINTDRHAIRIGDATVSFVRKRGHFCALIDAPRSIRVERITVTESGGQNGKPALGEQLNNDGPGGGGNSHDRSH